MKKKQGLKDFANSQDLRAANARLLRKLEKAENRTEELIAATQRAVQDSLSGMEIPPVAPPTRTVHEKVAAPKLIDEEKAIVILSDVQLGKVTPTYNSDVANERLQRYARKVCLLTDIARHDHPVREARVYLLGDQVEGEFNFPHQPHQIDSSLFRQIAGGAKMHAEFLRTLLGNFDKVHVVGVIGNHGRIGGRNQCVNPESNSDRMLYEWTKDLLQAETRLTWNLPWMKNERAWYAVDYPFGRAFAQNKHLKGVPHGFLLFHGDQIPGSGNHSDATIARHLFGWASGAVAEPFTYAVYGHWHRPRSSRFNKLRFWCNGSTESTNTYAQERIAAVGFPEQYLLFAHATRGVTSEYLVDLMED